MKRFLLLAVSALVLIGCVHRETPSVFPPPPRQAALVKSDYSQIPGWVTADFSPALAAFRASCREIDKRPDSRAMGGAGFAGTAADWREPCRMAAIADSQAASTFFRQYFAPFVVRPPVAAPALFTGYYEPSIAARSAPEGAFRIPVYGRPADLVDVNLGDFRPAWRGERTAGKVVAGRLVPYASRAEIDAQGLKAPVLFYTDSAVDLFFLQIQGSGRALFADASMMRVSYDGQNGHPYTAIGKTLLQRGALNRDELSLFTIKAWLKANPLDAQAVMETNASYAFLKLEPLGDAHVGAKGAEGVPLTAQASVAVDPLFHAFGTPIFLDAAMADGRPLRSLFVAQDRGGAIRGAARADIYFGYGPVAEAKAGPMKSGGQMFVLLPLAAADRLGAKTVLGEAVP